MKPRKPIRYEVHAPEQMDREGITEDEIEQAIYSPTHTQFRSKNRTGGRWYFKTFSSGRTIKVAAKNNTDHYFVTTVKVDGRTRTREWRYRRGE